MSMFFLLILICFVSCNEKPSNTIRIGALEGPSAISFIQMIDNPQFINGKKVEIIIKSDPQQIQALMMQHKLDFAILPTVMAANLYNKGVDFKIIAVPIWGTLYVLANHPGIKSFSDLNNQTISVFGQGATPDILLQRFVEYNSLTGVNIDYSYSGNNDLSQALLHKKVRIAVVSEPMASILLTKDSSIHIVTKLNCEEFVLNTDVDIFAQTSFLVNNKYIENYGKSIDRICAAYSRSCNFINDQPDEAARLLVKHRFLTDFNAARISLPLCNIRYVGAFAVERELMKYLNIFFEYDPASIGGKLPNRNIIYQPE